MNTPNTILVATDFSETSRAALDYAVSLAIKLGSKVHVAHAYEVPIVGIPQAALAAELSMQIAAAAQKELDVIVRTYAERGVTLSTSLEQGDARDGVLAAATRIGADMIVVGTHGRRGAARFFIGSIAEGLVRRSPVPVVVVHGPPAKN